MLKVLYSLIKAEVDTSTLIFYFQQAALMMQLKELPI